MRVDLTILCIRIMTFTKNMHNTSYGSLGLSYTNDNEELILERYRYANPHR